MFAFYLFILICIIVAVFWLIPRSEQIGEWFINIFKPVKDDEEEK